ncbi:MULTISPECIES: BID domain-containing T4SS effector [unclassified Bartonella]|uniref:BID domain-containing T4SS effector n=1 Tax=unclassified Bartonella TaxID=2645622 RepID=UPI00099B008B|nr:MULTISPECIES: BID domain-containing T4SS effector [unclassified Bartonella]AQX27883.1 Bartonella effector protein Bep3/1 [Bartonella sp. JB15]AQX29163.1 Bartonella effector protein Bep3/1 [Bartonella sp. JB63]
MPTKLLSLTAKELKKRRRIVDSAIYTHTIENITLHPDTLLVLERYAEGDYSLDEFNVIMDTTEKIILDDMQITSTEESQVEENIISFNFQSPSPYHYTYPRSFVLKNKHGITDEKILSMVSGHHTVRAILNLHHETLPEHFDSSYLKYIHKCLFGNTFEWAGNTRDVAFTFADGTSAIMPTMRKMNSKNSFAKGERIAKELQNLDKILAECNNLQGLSRQDFVHKATGVFTFLNYIHPFRDGNGRTQRMFFEKLAEAAGHQLDFSVVTAKRMVISTMISITDSGNIGDISAVRHMLEDISNPENVCVLKEFMNSMNEIERKNAQKRIILAPNKDEIYTGIYESDSPDSILLKIDRNYIEKPLYMVFKKDYLSPEQLKALKVGDEFSFKDPIKENIKNLENLLIPKERLAFLTEEQIVERIKGHYDVQLKREEVNFYAKRVYRKLKKFDAKIETINQNTQFGRELIQQITNSPESISRLAGKKILGIGNLKYKSAKQNVYTLIQKVDEYVNTVKRVKSVILGEHLMEQKRLATIVEMPSKEIQNIFNLPKDMQREALKSSSSLHEELNNFIKKVRSRLTLKEYVLLYNANYKELAESVGISESRAKQIKEIFTKNKILQNSLKQIKFSDTQIINIVN